ncbi:MAG: hypothetical protein JSW73_00890 [Candidatus Woesearchaeota archaeon]|nr:MAG: hypothetical protein JSW73_00890 [Candidatus Woesearchaeota archaeon]
MNTSQTYRLGRAMSTNEYKYLKRTYKLLDPRDPNSKVPTFQSNIGLEKKLLQGGHRIENFFKKIGVKKPDWLVILNVPSTDVEEGVVQSNGLKGILVNPGTPVDLVYARAV